MQECLGLYVSNQLIKYAKVSKDHDNLKVDSHGVKFYDKLEPAIQQIIKDTASFKTPISMNLSNEIYNYYDIFNLLKKNDIQKTISTEFDAYCFERKLNKNAFETRYALTNSLDNKDKFKAILVADNKMDIQAKNQLVSGSNLKTLASLPISIANIANLKPKENIMIINMEDTTTVTTVINQKVYRVDKIDAGMEEILNKINEKENSYLKAYDICKNTTIYTMETADIQETENEYLEYIIPVLYKIVKEVIQIKEDYERIDKVYITGTATVINNIDLYFQEYMKDSKCEILKPFFIADNYKINIKDYIEVNSALALALQGLGYGIKDMNFKKLDFSEQLLTLLHTDVKDLKGKGKGESIKINMSLKGPIDTAERWMIRTAAGLVILIGVYSGLSIFLSNQIKNKTQEAASVEQYAKTQTKILEADDTKILDKKTQYTTFKKNLEDTSNQLQIKNSRRNSIPTLLNEIMYVIPKNVQLTSIENATDKHVVIRAQSTKYEQLAYFKVQLKNEGILNNVVSTDGTKEGDMVKIAIEGDLP